MSRYAARPITIVDTGALYALIDTSDAWHEPVVSWWEQDVHGRRDIRVPVTVLPELCYLLASRVGAQAEIALVDAVAAGDFVVEPLDDDDFARIGEIMQRYGDLPLGFVDASLVALAERLDARDLLTTDRRHFSVVRPQHVRQFTLLPAKP